MAQAILDQAKLDQAKLDSQVAEFVDVKDGLPLTNALKFVRD